MIKRLQKNIITLKQGRILTHADMVSNNNDEKSEESKEQNNEAS